MGRWIVQGGLTQKSNAPRFGSFRPDPLVIWRKWCDEYVPSSASLVYDHHKLYQSRLLVRRGEHYGCVASDRPSVNPGDGCEMLIIAQICSPILCFLGSVDRVAYLFGLPVDVTGPRGSVTWLRSASAASRRLSRRFFGADAAAWFAGVWCALVCYPGSTTSTTCGCVRLRAVACGWYGVGTIRLRLVIVRLYGGL